MKKLVILGSSAAVLAVLAVAGTAFASHSWGGYHWARTNNPFTLKLGDNVSSMWDSILVTASSDWNAPSATSTVLNTTIVPGEALRSRSSQKDCSPKTGRVEVCNKTYGNNGWLGIAQIWITGGKHITQGAVKLNDTYFNTSKYNNPNEKLHVMCQEIGHTFGLDHQSEDGSSQNTCMDYFSNTGAKAGSTLSTKPNQHDYDELALIYSHLDSTNTLSLSADGGGKGRPATVGQSLDLNDPSVWGRAVRKDTRGNNSLYERDLGRGEKLFTFVTWAE